MVAKFLQIIYVLLEHACLRAFIDIHIQTGLCTVFFSFIMLSCAKILYKLRYVITICSYQSII